MHEGNKEWNISLLHTLFSDDDCRKITQLPTSIFQREDELFWWPSKLGEYSVKFGYWLGRLGHLEEAESQLTDDDREIWRVVWCSHRPPKLNYFVWKACRGNLVVKELLQHRHIAPDGVCGCCRSEIESVNHALFECAYAKDIWDGSDFVDILIDAPNSSFKTTLLWLSRKLDPIQLTRLLAMAWATWFCRNKRIFANASLSVKYVAVGFVKNVLDYKGYAQKVFNKVSGANPSFASRWNCPPVGMIKINVDAHLAAAGYIGLGAVSRDHHGSLIVDSVRKVSGVWEVDLAEAAAIRYGMQVVVRLGFRKAWVKSDY
ncbi:uncharacterized protein LOC110703748 [Chenopodium quinoa]|uniref:uncharacterized protein LOC110703748 n=1 Tax=Chenopodium quinoa TaxID=63459 RepID=UPI000B7780C4|nr:uncharacterized protein LOC110703748 [Chenopodium quinoa]